MNFSCCICFNVFQGPDNVVSTACGHIFHQSCLYDWLEHSQTCPQCRKNTPVSKIHRLYFNIDNNVSAVHNDSIARTMQNQVEALTTEVSAKDHKIAAYKKQVRQISSEKNRLKHQLQKARAEAIEQKTILETDINILQEKNKNQDKFINFYKTEYNLLVKKYDAQDDTWDD